MVEGSEFLPLLRPTTGSNNIFTFSDIPTVTLWGSLQPPSCKSGGMVAQKGLRSRKNYSQKLLYLNGILQLQNSILSSLWSLLASQSQDWSGVSPHLIIKSPVSNLSTISYVRK